MEAEGYGATPISRPEERRNEIHPIGQEITRQNRTGKRCARIKPEIRRKLDPLKGESMKKRISHPLLVGSYDKQGRLRHNSNPETARGICILNI
ncbi:hypothetical protein J6590_078646 [Homalodisca vitripennis]|nr:hypothetical protein J6590_078646 [Homalodisca vitripennis]